MTRRLVALALVAAGAVACSPEAATYSDVGSLASAVRDAGVACADMRPEEPSDLVKARATCDSGEGSLTLFVFGDDGDRERWATVAGQLGEVTAGPNWAVLGPAAAIEEITDRLGAARL